MTAATLLPRLQDDLTDSRPFGGQRARAEGSASDEAQPSEENRRADERGQR